MSIEKRINEGKNEKESEETPQASNPRPIRYEKPIGGSDNQPLVERAGYWSTDYNGRATFVGTYGSGKLE
ncbi:MAG: hypothetical protein WC533_01335 [Candidatus Pacearchaeota archaeon]